MNEKSSSQLELFSQSGAHRGRRAGIGNSFLRRIWAYEKTILMTMGFIITAMVAFSLGVEKGRQPVMQADRPKLIPEQQQPLVERKPAAVIPSPQNYTIQLASYKSKTSAQKEADSLKKKGLSPLIVSKGRYAVLCVGSFSDKENAKALLAELEKQYRGCFIRRI